MRKSRQPAERAFTIPASRRSVLLGMSVALFAAGGARHPGGGTRPAPDPAFLALSRSLTGDVNLDPLHAARLSAAFGTIAPEVHARFGALSQLYASNPQLLLTAAASHDLKATALAIVAAWHAGAPRVHTGNATSSDTAISRQAADVSPPTYASGGSACG